MPSRGVVVLHVRGRREARLLQRLLNVNAPAALKSAPARTAHHLSMLRNAGLLDGPR